MPSASVAPDAHPQRARGHWGTAGLALLAVWSTFFAVGVALWAKVAFFPGEGSDPNGYLRLLGAPFVLVALGLLWWAWWSARALRQRRREGWTLLLVLGGVAVAQSVMTAPGVVAATGQGTSGPPRELVGGMLAAIALGLLTLTVAVLGRRSRPGDAAGRTTKQP